MMTPIVTSSQKISIGGVYRPITPYSLMVACETNVPNPSTGLYSPLNQYQYVSMLLNNLGYTKTSSDTSWIDAGQPVENVQKDAVLDYPITHHVLMLRQDRDTLWNVLEAIRNWGRAKIEQGVMLDTNESFQLPDAATVQYNIENGIAVRRNAASMITPMKWCMNDIFSRRLHAISPQISLEYFNNCIRNFEEYAKQIMVDRPYAMFTAAMINPDIVMSMIKNAEIEASKIVNKLVGGYAAFRPDYETAKKFTSILGSKNNHLINVFYKRGPKGFVEMRKLVTQEDIEKTLAMHNESYLPTQIKPEDEFSEQPLDVKRAMVAEYDLNTAVSEVEQYVNTESFPEPVVGYITVTDDRGNSVKQYEDQYAPVMKRISRIIKQVKIYYPDLFSNNRDKWIMSKPFYANQDAFALYSQKERLFILAYPDMEFQILDPKDAIKAYKDRYGIDIILDPDEMGDAPEAPECSNITFLENIEPDPTYVLPDAIVPLQSAESA